MVSTRSAGGSIKFILIGLFGLFAAVLVTVFVAYTFITNTQSTTQDFYTVQELQAKGNRFVGKNLRLSGAVLGDTIQFDSQTLTLSFMVVNISREATDLDTAVNDPNAPRVRVIYIGPKPELLRHGVQVFVYGKLGKDGVFYADELLVNWKNTPY